MLTPTKENAPVRGAREIGTFAAPLGGSAKVTSEFPTDKRDVPILDAAGLDVLKAYRYFKAEAEEPPVIVAALLTVAWAMRGRT